jgi:sec-independent protein translocase protein TatB
MLGMGWQEIFLIAVVAVIVVGPKELPRVLRTASYWFRKVKDMAREFQSGIEDVIRESELQELRKELEETTKTDISQSLIDSVDPTGDFKGAVQGLEDAITPVEEGQILDKATAIAEPAPADDALEGTDAGDVKPTEAISKEPVAAEQSAGQDDDMDAAPERTGGVV